MSKLSVDSIVIRFAGDSGDGLQVIGSQFAESSAALGNEISIQPDFPADIRAPGGSLGGVSAYQVHFTSKKAKTAGDLYDCLVAFNAAALKTNGDKLKEGGFLFVDVSGFSKKYLGFAGYETNPLEDGSLDGMRIIKDDFTALTVSALENSGLSSKESKRCKNFFMLGMVYWLYEREMKLTENWLNKKFAKKPDIAAANIAVMNAGWTYAENLELVVDSYKVPAADLAKGTYKKVFGNEATGIGIAAAGLKAGKEVFLASYPITPATEILYTLAAMKRYGVKTLQMEDEIASMVAAVGAAYAGSLAVTTTSGPGLCLKSEGLNLAVIAELPVVVVNVQRGGPSTGLPTKTEQSDLLQAMYGRNGDSPLVVLAANSPADCFKMGYEASRLAMQFMTPVVLLTDGFIGFGAEPFKIPKASDLPDLDFPNVAANTEDYLSYSRDKDLVRPWAIPGTEGLMHRIGGLEKQDGTGTVNTGAENHQIMTDHRKNKIANIANYIPEQGILGSIDDDILVISWGGTWGTVESAVEDLRASGKKVAYMDIKYINPFPKNLSDILNAFKKVTVCELNNGQMKELIQGTYGISVDGYNKVEGQPFAIKEIVDHITAELGGN
ncbi:MAG: 2-oxoacid:acceptor oxidoreductase subunit alpha [Fibrobacterales bacterium]